MSAGLRVLAERLAAAEGPSRELDAEIVRLFGRVSHTGIPVCAEIAGIGSFTADLTAADRLLTALGLTWSKSLDGHVYVADPARGIGCRSGEAGLALKLCRGAVWHAIDRAEREATP